MLYSDKLGRVTATHKTMALIAIAVALALGCDGNPGVEESKRYKQEPLKNFQDKDILTFSSCDALNDWNGVISDKHVVFPAGCAYHGQVKFMASDLTLDCNSGSIEGSDEQGVLIAKDAQAAAGNWPAVVANPHSDYARYQEITPDSGAKFHVLLAGIVIGDPTTPPASKPRWEGPMVEDITIRNCTVRGFYQGIRLDRQFAQVLDVNDQDADGNTNDYVSPRERTFYDGYQSTVDYDAIPGNAGYKAEFALGRTQLYNRAPKRVRVVDSLVEKNGHGGIYVVGYSQHFSIEQTTVRDNGSVGIYLSHESRYTTIERSEISRNGVGSNAPAVNYRVPRTSEVEAAGREGISIDSSAHNTVSHSLIHDNYKGGIALYKNCGEKHRGVPGVDENGGVIPIKPSVIRKMHADYNRIIHNTFTSHTNKTSGNPKSGFGIWLAMRQGQDFVDVPEDFRHCRDPQQVVGSKKYNHDYASFNEVAYNSFEDNWLSIRVSDDFNQIVGNHFLGVSRYDMYIGDTFRQQLQDPVRGTTIVKNRSWATIMTEAEDPVEPVTDDPNEPPEVQVGGIFFIGGSGAQTFFYGDMYYERRVENPNVAGSPQKCLTASFNDCTRPPEQLLHGLFWD